MGTRSTTHFREKDGITEAIVYQHWDGYPEGAGTDILKFLMEIKQNVRDTRFFDASYLAARYVVFLGNKFRDENKNLLDFTSVGICLKDPGDIAYRYVVECGNLTERGLPNVICWKLGYPGLKEVKCETIPEPEDWEDPV